MKPEKQKFSISTHRDFMLYWIGQSVSLIGDQFYVIALPWLVMNVTQNAYDVGFVLALVAFPRAFFMLFGGALTDRYSPKTVMVYSNLFRMLVVGMLAMVVFTGIIEMWMIRLFALTFGIGDAFFYPARMTIIPKLVEKKYLSIANSLVEGMRQISMFIAPLMAGALIAFFENGNTGTGSDSTVYGTKGIAYCFLINSIAFSVSVITLTMIRVVRSSTDGTAEKKEPLLGSIKSGFSYLWKDVVLKQLFYLVAARGVFIIGPIFVAVPILIKEYLKYNATHYGYFLSAFGGGSLLGILMAMKYIKPSSFHSGKILLVVSVLLGVGMALFGIVTVFPVLCVISFIVGALNGYVNISFITWLQKYLPEEIMGRIMSLVIFAGVGLVPVSQALTGLFMDYSITGLFIVTGSLMVVTTLLITFFSKLLKHWVEV